MKTIIFILMTVFCSCEICEECTTITTQNGSNVPLSTATTEVCGRKEIKAMEGTTSATSGSVTVKSTTTCR